jgi:hypothetical protein
MLLGLVLGLAIYNRVLLDFPLPLALYKKLLAQVGSSRRCQTPTAPPRLTSLQSAARWTGTPSWLSLTP